MISPADGSVDFEDGLHLVAFGPVPIGYTGEGREFALPGWHCYEMGERRSEYGLFRVQVVCDPKCRIALVWLCHESSSNSPRAGDEEGDPERRAFHEGVIRKDLAGQREFSWGGVYLRYDPDEQRDALIVAYSRGAAVPYAAEPEPLELVAHAVE